jgi:hypothetical protein
MSLRTKETERKRKREKERKDWKREGTKES